MAKKKKFPVFWVCFAVFIAVMAVFWVVIIANVKKCLVIYENSQPEYTVEKYVERFRDGSILDSLDFAQALLKDSQVAVVPGEDFGAPGYCRLSYAVSDERILESMRRLGAFVDKLSAAMNAKIGA